MQCILPDEGCIIL
jgi:hypothetical protein